jgi:hypothetical protein
MKIKLPKVSFSNWIQWNKRETIQDINFPGVYLLAKFKTVPTGRANPLHENIIYIGETCRTLKERWVDFDRSAFQSKPGHSGGWQYQYEYPDDTGKNLYVTAFPVKNLDDEITPWFIRFQERKLLLDFVCKHGATYLLNQK